MEDQIAISRLKQGDLNGLEALVRRYQARAVHAAYMIVYDRSLAEDVVQTCPGRKKPSTQRSVGQPE